DHLIIEVGDCNTSATGVFEVSDINPHTGSSFTLGAERNAGLDRDVLERAVVVIAIELVRLRVIRDQQIGPAVLIVINQRYSWRFRAAVKNPAAGSHVFKSAIA